MRHTLFALVLFSLSGFASSETAIYRWYDNQGQLHLTQSPPPPGAKNALARGNGTMSVYKTEWTNDMKREARVFMRKARVQRVWVDQDGKKVPGWY
jgi:hypothetical protein